MNAISLNHLWSYLQGLSLTASNQRWLANHLIEAAERTERKTQEEKLVFPKIPKDYIEGYNLRPCFKCAKKEE